MAEGMLVRAKFFQTCLHLWVVMPMVIGAGDPQKKADPTPEAVPGVLSRYLSEVKGAKWGSLSRVSSESLQTTFPKVQFFSLRFRKFPSEVVPTPPLKSNNLFVVQDDKVVHITTEADLSKFFVERFPAKPDPELVKAGTESWLSLAAVLSQDGFYEFLDPVVQAGVTESHGTLAVKPKSGKGELRVTLKFKDGRLVEVAPGGEVVPGRRLR